MSRAISPNAPAPEALEWDSPRYRLAVGQLDQTAKRMQLDANIWERLRTPQRALIVSFPFRRDNYDTVETVHGYRVQHLLTMIELMRRAFRDVWAFSQAEKVDLRTAAPMRGIRRVAEAKRRRGVFP